MRKAKQEGEDKFDKVVGKTRKGAREHLYCTALLENKGKITRHQT